MSTPQLTFRPYTPADLGACGALAAEAWPEFASLVSEADRAKFLRSYIRICLPISTRLEVAELDGKLVGFLFGSVEADFLPVLKPLAWLTYAGVSVKFLLGGYGRLRHPLEVMRMVVGTEKNAEAASPGSDCSIELLVISQACRGLGIGRRMLERFTAHARSRDAATLTLFTDMNSDFGFYEHLGFHKYAEFPDRLNSYLRQRPMQGSVYILAL